MLPDLTPLQVARMTFTFILVMTVIAITYDVVIIWRYGAYGSISRVLVRLFQQYPIIFVTFLIWIGVLVGHLIPA